MSKLLIFQNSRFGQAFLLFVILLGTNIPPLAQGSEFSWKSFFNMTAIQTSEQVGTDDGVGPDLGVGALSHFGMAGTVEISENFDGLFQMVGGSKDSLRLVPEIEYALLNYRLNESFTFRTGRLSIPVWLISEYRSVSYLHPWIRPPSEVYSLNPIDSITGVNLINKNFGDKIKSTLEMYLGGSSVDTHTSTNVRSVSTKDVGIVGASVRLEADHGILRLSYIRGNGVNLKQKIEMRTPSGTPSYNIVSQLETEFNLGWVDFIAFGLQKEFGPFLLMAEFAQERAERVLNERSSAYGTLQYDICDQKNFVQYTYSELLKNDFEGSQASGRQLTNSLGYKYVFNSNLLLKLEYSRTHLMGAGSALNTDLNGGLGSSFGYEAFQTYAVSIESIF